MTRPASLSGMVFANVGTLGTQPAQRDSLVAHLSARSDRLSRLGCLNYEVGVNDEQPDTV